MDRIEAKRANRILRGSHVGNDLRGNPRRWWENNIKMGFREICRGFEDQR
jgi:hypothetical protein